MKKKFFPLLIFFYPSNTSEENPNTQQFISSDENFSSRYKNGLQIILGMLLGFFISLFTIFVTASFFSLPLDHPCAIATNGGEKNLLKHSQNISKQLMSSSNRSHRLLQEILTEEIKNMLVSCYKNKTVFTQVINNSPWQAVKYAERSTWEIRSCSAFTLEIDGHPALKLVQVGKVITMENTNNPFNLEIVVNTIVMKYRFYFSHSGITMVDETTKESYIILCNSVVDMEDIKKDDLKGIDISKTINDCIKSNKTYFPDNNPLMVSASSEQEENDLYKNLASLFILIKIKMSYNSNPYEHMKNTKNSEFLKKESDFNESNNPSSTPSSTATPKFGGQENDTSLLTEKKQEETLTKQEETLKKEEEKKQED